MKVNKSAYIGLIIMVFTITPACLPIRAGDVQKHNADSIKVKIVLMGDAQKLSRGEAKHAKFSITAKFKPALIGAFQAVLGNSKVIIEKDRINCIIPVPKSWKEIKKGTLILVAHPSKDFPFAGALRQQLSKKQLNGGSTPLLILTLNRIRLRTFTIQLKQLINRRTLPDIAVDLMEVKPGSAISIDKKTSNKKGIIAFDLWDGKRYSLSYAPRVIQQSGSFQFLDIIPETFHADKPTLTWKIKVTNSIEGNISTLVGRKAPSIFTSLNGSITLSRDTKKWGFSQSLTVKRGRFVSSSLKPGDYSVSLSGLNILTKNGKKLAASEYYIKRGKTLNYRGKGTLKHKIILVKKQIFPFNVVIQDKVSLKPIATAKGVLTSTDGLRFSLQSSADGSFSKKSIPQGIYRLTLTAPGYLTSRRSLDIQQPLTANFSLTPLVTQSFYITDEAGQPVGRAVVIANWKKNQKHGASGISDNKGIAKLNGVPVTSNLWVSVHSEGYATTCSRFTVKGAALPVKITKGSVITGQINGVVTATARTRAMVMAYHTDAGIPVGGAKVKKNGSFKLKLASGSYRIYYFFQEDFSGEQESPEDFGPVFHLLREIKVDPKEKKILWEFDVSNLKKFKVFKQKDLQ